MTPPAERRTFVSADPDATREYLTGRFAGHRMSLRRSGPFTARIGCVDLGGAAIADIAYGAEVSVEPDAERAYYLVHAALEGQGAVAADGQVRALGDDNLLVSSPGCALEIRRAACSRHITVKIGRSALEHYAGSVLKLDIREPVAFSAAGPEGSELPRLWRDLLQQILRQADAYPTAMAAPSARSLYVWTLIDHLLGHHPHNYSAVQQGREQAVAPWHVRRAIERIESWTGEPFSVAAMARQVGVSTRTLQLGFRRFVGVTPAEYVRERRVEQLHLLLSRAAPEASVTELMLRLGVSDFGRFAARYRRRYGLTPSQSLLRSRRG